MRPSSTVVAARQHGEEVKRLDPRLRQAQLVLRTADAPWRRRWEVGHELGDVHFEGAASALRVHGGVEPL